MDKKNDAGLQIIADLGQPCPSLYCAALKNFLRRRQGLLVRTGVEDIEVA